MPGSERLYYSDSFLQSFTGAVVEARELGSGEGAVWQLALDRTAFYPTSGGQPFDTGLLRVGSQSGTRDVPVEQVEEDEEGRVWHFVRTPLRAGTAVTGEIDWERRLDHMQQHTGQHLLSAVFQRELQAATVSFHLGESVSTIDVAHGPPAHHSLERVERMANQIIAEDRPVMTRLISRAEAEGMLSAGELRKLPERQGSIRLIEIRDCDVNACGGTHVRSTGQIGGLLLRGVEKVSRGTRIEFVCGMRAVGAARADAAVLAEAAAMLSSGVSELPSSVARLLSEAKVSAKEQQKLRQELAAYHAAALVMEVPVEKGVRLVERSWKDRDRDYVKLLASRTAAAAPSTAVMFSSQERNPASIFIARSPDLRFDCGGILRQELARLGLRGGGSADLAQGEVPLQQEAGLRTAVVQAIYEALAAANHGR